MDGNRKRAIAWACGAFFAVCLRTTPAAPAADGPPPYVRPPAADLQLPSDPGDHKLKFTTTVAGRRVTLPYLLHVPPPPPDGRRSPMLVFFHGAGECGTDLAAIYHFGPMTLFRPDSSNPTLAASWPFVTLCPQCPPRGEKWSDEPIYLAAAELVAAVVHGSDRLDPDRVYATGLSMGGLGTWCVAEAAPDLFAAAAPVSAMPWRPDVAGDRLRSVAVWTATGLQDEPRFVDGGRAMERALAPVNPADRFNYFPHDGHGVYGPVYDSPAVFEWLLAHRRSSAPAASRPTSQPTTPLPPGHHLLTYDATVGDQRVRIDYVLYVPRAAADRTGRRPALLFLAEQNTIGPVYDDLCLHGPDLALARDPALAATFPFVVVSPRLPVESRWTDRAMARALAGLLDHVGQNVVPLDPDRTSVTGIDSGAFAAWWLADALPDRFAAMLWVSTRADDGPPTDNGKLVRLLPGRAFFPAANTRLTQRLTAEIKLTSRDWATFPTPPTASTLGDLPAYSDRTLVDWLTRQHREPREH